MSKSSGNVFADLEVSNPTEALAKADLAIEIIAIIKRRELTQISAAEILGIKQPHVSKLMRGDLEGFSMERLIRFLNTLDRDIEIVIRKRSESTGFGQTFVTA